MRSKLKTFFNLSYSQRFNEEAADASVTASDDKVTWAPWITANLGVTGDVGKGFKASVLSRYMSAIDRKVTDTGANHAGAGRASSIDAWVGIDGAIHYPLSGGSEVSLFVKNILDDGAILMKPRDNTFDYQTEGRAVYLRYTQGF